MPVAQQAGHRDRGVVRPDRTIVITHRVVGAHRRWPGCATRTRNPSPHYREPLNDFGRVLVASDPGPQAVGDVAGQRVDAPFAAIQSDCIPTLFGEPERFEELAAQGVGAIPQVGGGFGRIAERLGQLGPPQQRSIQIALHLASAIGGSAVRPSASLIPVEAVLPALMEWTTGGWPAGTR